MKITFEDIYNNKEIQLYIRQADESMRAMGYTEHSFAHVGRVANWAQDILLKLGYSERDAGLTIIWYIIKAP